MSLSRLELALASAGGLPAEGSILALGAPASADLSPLPPGRTTVVQGFRPDHDAWAARGYSVTPGAEGKFAAAVAFIPRARAAGRAMVAEAVAHVAPGTPVWIDGQKTDGIDPLLREIRARVSLSAPVAKAHGKCAVFAAPGPEVFTDWQARPSTPAPGFTAPPGAFSADAVDEGSRLLADLLPQGLKGRAVDLGAGWGWLSRQVLDRPGISELHLVEADHAPLEAAKSNIDDPRASFHWADATAFSLPGRASVVVTNPPFHVARAADPALGLAFIAAAAGMLRPDGELYLVANRQLPYERALAARFVEVAEIGGDGRFKVFRAARPRTSDKGHGRR